MKRMKHALVGLVLGGLSTLMSRDWPGVTPSFDEFVTKAARRCERSRRHRPAFNGGLPSVKQAQRQAKAKRAGRRVRRLGHA